MSKSIDEKTHMQIFKSDKDRFKKLADDEKRTMLVMFSMLLDNWEKMINIKVAKAAKKVKKDVS